jgi:tetratricopeptide (TPR) repeat protein
MKLGRLSEAIKEARVGVLVGGDPGRTLNMLGILLSMNGEPEAAIQSLREALTVELSAGEQGQPATPLNNMGEVFRELFQDEKAEAAWIKTHTYPDGCEHVLPSLNLALLYLEQAKYAEAKEAMDWFQSCVLKYSLKNDEEHRALVNLARGRVSLLTGSPQKALENFQHSLQSTQWFGKIGTNQDDLILGATISAAQAYKAAANRLYFTAATSWKAWIENQVEELSLRMKSFWSFRKAAIMASERLNNLEDLEIHHTDSLIEYATLGETLAFISVPTFKRRLDEELATDHRPASKPYYLAYEAENLKAHGDRSRSLGMFKEALKLCRPGLDARLRAHILANLATYYSKTSSEYLALTRELFGIARSLIRNYGLVLPINIVQTRPSVIKSLEKVGFYVLSGEPSPFIVQASELPNNELKLEFQSSEFGVQQIVSTGSSIPELVNGLSDAVFSQQIQ